MGAVTGLRSFSGPAIVSWSARRRKLPLSRTKLRFLGTAVVADTFATLSAGELMADKLPFMPNRTEPGSLAARVASGGLCGAAVFAANRRQPALGALVGGAAAAGSAFAGYQLRRRAVRRLRVPDPAIAVIEDAIAVGGGAAAMLGLA